MNNTFEYKGLIFHITSELRKEVEVTENLQDCDDIYIPSIAFNGECSYSVTRIRANAFSYCDSPTWVNIPHTVTEIGEEAFCGCKWLETAIIPCSVMKIDTRAFAGCGKLTEVTIPCAVSEIGEGIFSSCIGLKKVNIPDSVTKIGNYAFWGCSSLTAINIPNSVTRIGKWAFYGCGAMNELAIPESVTEIGEWAFSWCFGLRRIFCMNPLPPIVGGNAFEKVLPTTRLYVPQGTLEKYSNAHGWSRFNSIREIVPDDSPDSPWIDIEQLEEMEDLEAELSAIITSEEITIEKITRASIDKEGKS